VGFSSGSATTKTFNVGRNAEVSTTGENGYSVLAVNDGNLYFDHKMITNGHAYYRFGSGASSGAASTWMQLDAASGLTTMPFSLSVNGSTTLGDATTDTTTNNGSLTISGPTTDSLIVKSADATTDIYITKATSPANQAYIRYDDTAQTLALNVGAATDGDCTLNAAGTLNCSNLQVGGTSVVLGGGNGATNKISKWTSTTTQGQSSITDDGTNVTTTESAFVGLDTGTGTQLINIGRNAELATTAQNGVAILALSDGNIYVDHKTITAGTINYRAGAGAETGGARNWLTVTPSTGAAAFAAAVTEAGSPVISGTVSANVLLKGSSGNAADSSITDNGSSVFTAESVYAGLDTGTGTKILNAGRDTSLTTNAQNGWAVNANTDGNIYVDSKVITGGSLLYRYGVGAQNGGTTQWLVVSPGSSLATFIPSVTVNGNLVGGDASTDTFTANGPVTLNALGGTVGIGMAAPTSIVKVDATSTTGGMRVTVPSNADGYIFGTSSKQWSWYPSGTDARLFEYNGLAGGAGNDRITIAAGGATTFSSSVTVTGGATFNSTIAANGTSGTEGQVLTIASGVPKWQAGATSSGWTGLHTEWIEEFITIPVTTAGTMLAQGILHWNGGTCSIANSGDATHPGVEVITANSTGGTCNFSRDNGTTSGSVVQFASGSTWTAEMAYRLPSLATGSTHVFNTIFGFAYDNSVQDQPHGCYFAYDDQNGLTGAVGAVNAAKWECWCASSSTRTKYPMDGTTVSDNSFTTVNAPVAINTWYHLKLVVTGTTKAEFFVDGTKRCEIATNIPTAFILQPMWRVSNGSATGASDHWIDWMRFAFDTTAARGT
jgi:hypothetical protein